jgi:heme-degrading monooxygenase HmoA
MFVALYEMKAKAGRELEFEKAWANVTEAIYRVRGSYGSRLHTSETAARYIAYAQWPSEEIFNKDAQTSYTDEEKSAFERMKDAAESVRLLHRLQVHADLLKPVR